MKIKAMPCFLSYFLSFIACFIPALFLDSLPTDMYLGGQYGYYSTNNLWTNNGKNVAAHNDFMRHEMKGYGGLDFNLNSCVWIQGGFDSIRQEVNPDRHGFEDSNLGLFAVMEEAGDYSFGCGLQVDAPGGEPRAALRYGSWASELYLNIQNRFYLTHISFDIGYRIFQKNVSDSVRAALRVDWPFTRKIQITAQGDLDFALFNGKRKFFDNRMAFNPNTRLFKAKVLGVYQVSDMFYLNAGYFKYLWGQNVGSGAGVFGGAFWNY